MLEDIHSSIYVPGFAHGAKERRGLFLIMSGRMATSSRYWKVRVYHIANHTPSLANPRACKNWRSVYYSYSRPNLRKKREKHKAFLEMFLKRQPNKCHSALMQWLNILNTYRYEDLPRLTVDLTRDRKHHSKFYGLTLTTLSAGGFKIQADLRKYVQLAVIGLKDKAGVRMELI